MKLESLTRRLGSQVVELRQRMGLTQAALADRASISLKYVSMIEAGTNSSLRTLLKLCDGLGVDIVTLIDEARRCRKLETKKRRVHPLHVSVPEDCPYFKKLLAFIRKLPDEERARALEILRSL